MWNLLTGGRAWGLLLPALLCGGTIWLTFSAGGFFAGTTAAAAIGAGVALSLWLTIARRPFSGVTWPLGIALGSLALLAAWTLASQLWSHAPARAVLESNRTLLYVLVVALFGLAAAAPGVRRHAPLAVAAALVSVSVCGLISRLLPETWPIAEDLEFERLSYPSTYWNAQGMIAALAVIAGLHLATSGSERRAIRMLGAAAIPIMAVALLLTFSRAAIGIAPLGVIVYLLLARPRHTVSVLLATLSTTTLALLFTYRYDAVIEAVEPTPELVTGGRSVAIVVAVAGLAAAALTYVLAPLDDAIQRRVKLTRLQIGGIAGIALICATAGAFALGIPGAIADRIEGLDQSELVATTGDSRERLSSLGDNGRIDQWKVALDAFERAPVLGEGAGTYPLLWARHRPTEQTVTDGHSLYLETMAEMGVVGLALVVGAIVALLTGCLLRRRTHRALGSLAFTIMLVWAVRAGIDWDWEVPALTAPVLALTAVAVGPAAVPARLEGVWPARIPRLLMGLAVLVGLLTPLSIARSQAHLDEAAAALAAGRCNQSISAALATNDALSIRPEPFSILATCDLRLGRPDLALAAVRAALRRDPDNWRLIYNRAIVRAVHGRDPRPGLRAALRANPRSSFLRQSLEELDGRTPSAWRRQARDAVLLQ